MLTRYPEKIGLFIDGSNLHHHQNALGLRIDWVRLRSFLIRHSNFLAYCGYYTAVEEDERGHRWLQPRLDHMAFHGYTVVQKPMKEYDGKKKGNVDVEMTMHIVLQAKRLDRVILASGDGDFEPLVAWVQSIGTRVTILSSTQGGMLSNELRKTANDLIDLAEIRNEICQLPA